MRRDDVLVATLTQRPFTLAVQLPNISEDQQTTLRATAFDLAGNDGETDQGTEESGPPIGLQADWRYEQTLFRLEPGASLLMFTDGTRIDRCGDPPLL